jgi:hypothetical protein
VLELPAPDAIAALDAAELPALVVGLAALQAAVGARLAAVQPPPLPADGDSLLDCAQAAALIGRSESWVRKHGHTLPGFVQHGHGGRVRWRRRALLAWAQGRVVD